VKLKLSFYVLPDEIPESYERVHEHLRLHFCDSSNNLLMFNILQAVNNKRWEDKSLAVAHLQVLQR
jgi:hypothetical protein